MFMMRLAAAARHSNTAVAVWRLPRRSFSVEYAFSEEHITKTTQSTTVHSSLSYGPIDYSRGWAWQQILLHRRLLRRAKRLQQPQENVDDNERDEQQDTILMFEHLPVYTLGRGADESHITVDIPDRDRLSRTCRRQRGSGSARLSMDKSPLSSTGTTTADSVQYLSEMATPVIAPNGVPIYRIDRGGEVTFHGPGQLVVYPLLDLQRCPMQQDLHWYLRQIEQVIIDTLHDDYDIPTTRDPDHTGVWYQPKHHQNKKGDNGRFAKVAAVGVSASRWITTHGFALNVRPTLQYFDASYIVPCGIHDKDVTSMEQIWREDGRETELPTVAHVAASVLNKMESVFGITVEKDAIIKIR